MTIKKQMRHVFRCPVIFGKDGGTLQAGYDCTWYGDEEDANFMWDTSANRMIFAGAAGITINGECDYAIDITDGVIRDTQTISAAAIDLNMDIDMATAGAAHVPVLYIDANQSTAYSGGALSCIKGKVYTTEHITNVYGAQLWAYSSGTHTMNDLTCVHAIVITGGTITADTSTSSTCSALSGYISNYSSGSWDGRVACLFLNYGSNVNYGDETAYIYMMSHADTKLDYGIHFTCLSSQQAVTAAILIEALSGATITTGIDIGGAEAGTITTGLSIGACTTDIILQNGATIINNASDELTITEDNVIITGNLQVVGTTTTIDTATITVDDPNIQLNVVASPTDSNADGGGITLMGTAPNKTIAWADTGNNWTFNQNVDLESTFVYKINNTQVLSASTLTLSEGATIADSADEISAGTGPGLTITQDQIGLTGKVEIGYTDWGVAGAGAIAITGNGWDWALQVNAKVTANLADAGAAVYHSMTVTASQTAASMFGTWTEMYFSDSINLTTSDNYAVVWGQLEAGTGVTFTDGEFTAAFYGNVKAGTSCTGASAINGFRAKLEIASTDSYTPGAGRLAAFESLASALEWDYGLYLNDYVTGIYFAETGAATEHLIDVVDAYLGLVIETGSYGDTATAVKLTSTNIRPASFLFDDGGVNIGGGADVRGVLSRIAVIAQQTGSSIAAMRGQCKLVGAIALTNYHLVGMEGYIEIAGTTTNAITLETDGSALACVRGRLEVNSDVTHATANTYMTAFFADLKVATGKTIAQSNGVLAGVVIDASNVSGAAAAVDYWGHGIYIADSATDIGITIGSTTTGIDIGACGTAGINIVTGQVLGINIAGTTTAGILKAGVSDSSLISGGLGAPAIAASWVGIGIFGTLTGASGRNAGGGYPEDHGVNIVLKEDGEVQFMYAIQGRAYVIGDGAGQDGVAQEIFGLYGRARIDNNGTVGYGSNGQAIGVYGLCYLRTGGTSDVGGTGVLAGGRFSYKDQGITHTTAGVRCGLMAEVEEGTPECIMYLLAHSGAGTIANAIDINDAGNDVTNLLKIRQANGCGTDISSWFADTHQPDGSLQIDVAGTTYWIPIHATRHTS